MHTAGTCAGPASQRYLVVASFFALGLLAKPMIITLPFLLLLADYWPLQRLGVPGVNARIPSFAPHFFKLALEKIPLLLLLRRERSDHAIRAMDRRSAGFHRGIADEIRVPNAIYSYLAYILERILAVASGGLLPASGGLTALWKARCSGS